jgi:hypothetical protein
MIKIKSRVLKLMVTSTELRKMIRQGVDLLIKSIYTGLYGVIRYQGNVDAIGCFIHSISEDGREAVVVAPTPLICQNGKAELRIITPTENSPIKCEGKISEDKCLVENVRGYTARVFITNSSRIDRRRLELLIGQKKACMSMG